MKAIRRLFEILRDPDRDFMERKFIMMTVLAISAVVIVTIGDIISGENFIEILMLSGTIFIVPTITAISVWKKKAKLGANLVAFGTVFAILPVVFFFGGGVRGGGIIWVVFGYLFVGVIAAGRFRIFLLACLTAEVITAYLISYYYPESVFFHDDTDFYFDSGVSVVLVGFLIYTMVWFLNRMFEAERKKAREEAKRAEEAIRTQNQFFSSMSHEIRTPINTVLGLNEIILRQEDASDEILKDAKNIQGAGKMLLALINDILDISKIEAGKMDIVPVSYDVADMVSELVNMIWIKAEEKGLKLMVDIDPSIPATLYGDEVRVKQVLINLLNNAVKYTKEGSVSLHMECERDWMGYVNLKATITDTGMGIKSEALPHLFDSFQRVDEEKNRHIEGTGLGLSIVKQLIDLMGGEITVNSVYGQGSTFVVTIRQRIESEEEIGNLEVTGSGDFGNNEKFEHMFKAPGCRVLIVDDNEMNLEVENKLLDGMEMTVDLSPSGADALQKTLKNSYDVIFLDHLMPEMDGIECYREIRRQVGGLNKRVPIIVLTANVGGENKELYDTTGFDGYLMKPVSGVQLEEMLLRFLPEEKVHMNATSEMTGDRIHTAGGYAKKKSVVITTSSMSDLPEEIRNELQIPTIPFLVYTDHGEFWDGEEAVSDELIRYMNVEGHTVASDVQAEEEYIRFFSKQLQNAHQVIHIALTTSLSEEFNRATAAAKSFDNVTVVNSESLSSATGLLVLVAMRLAMRGTPADRIVEELEEVKKKIRCSFVVASTDFMARAGHISSRLNTILKTLWVRPSLRFKKDVFGVDRLMMGSIHRCYEKYINHALPRGIRPDKEVLFITYVDLSEEDLQWIEKEVRKRVKFEHIIFQKASSAISANCGPGSFGLLYMEAGKVNYHLGAFIPEEREADEAELEIGEDLEETADEASEGAEKSDSFGDGTDVMSDSNDTGVPEEYRSLAGIDAEKAITNCGSEESFKMVLQIFYDSMDVKEKELRTYFSEEAWSEYTIKIHALKSSAKLVGAFGLAEDAEALEMAGKEENIDYIRENHERVMNDYVAYRDILKDVVDVKEPAAEEEDGAEDDRPTADEALLAEVFDRIRSRVDECDDMGIEEALDELDGYRIPNEAKEKIAAVREGLDQFDFDAISAAISE